MKPSTKRTALVVASLMTINSVAFAATADATLPPSAVDRLRELTPKDDLVKMVSEASDIKVADLISTRDYMFDVIDTLNAIKSNNESDLFLKYANGLQTGLALVTTTTLAAHINSAEKRRLMLSLSAASAVITSAIRF